MNFPNLHYDSIKPFEIHVYPGSSFRLEEKWVVKDFEGLTDYFKSREIAVKAAIKRAHEFLFPQTIYVHSFGSQYMNRRIIRGRFR